MKVTNLEMRGRISRVTKHLFLQKGYGSTTVQDIIRDAGVAKGAFYHHFISKEDLLSEVADSIKGVYMEAKGSAASEPGLDAMQRFTAIERSIGDVEEALPRYVSIVKDGTTDTPHPGTAAAFVLLSNVISLWYNDDSTKELAHFREAVLLSDRMTQ